MSSIEMSRSLDSNFRDTKFEVYFSMLKVVTLLNDLKDLTSISFSLFILLAVDFTKIGDTVNYTEQI